MKFTIPSEVVSHNSKKAMPPATALKHGEGGPSGYGPNGTTKHAMAPKTWVDFKGAPKGYDPKPLMAPPRGMKPSSE
jgi:hypothetical protein